MAPIDVPKEHGYIAGRSHENAVRALQAASDAGYPDSSVLTRQGGYVVPLEVLSKYEELSLVDPSAVVDALESGTEPEDTTSTGEETPAGQNPDDQTSTEGGEGETGEGESATGEPATGESDPETGSESEQETGEGEPTEESTEESTEATGEPQPAGNASTAVWSEWAAKNRGYDPSEGLDRKALIERYGEKE